MLSTIVVGVDASAQTRDAIALARAVAGATGARLLLVHAYPYDLLPLGGTVTEVRVAEEMHADAVRFTAGLRDALAPGADVHVLPDTSPARALHEVCEEEHAGVLVVGSAQRGPDGRASAGGTARAALHHAPCPVLVAPRGLAGDGAPPPRLDRVGVGVDGSHEAGPALELARALAAASGARLVLLTAVGRPDEVEATRARLAGAADGAEAEVLQGPPAAALVERSARLDLLVLGSRGRGPVRRLLLGGTSERVVRDAACAVLVVPRAG
jgi:nucleotide-binding universal stress UspA family protein